MLERWGSAVWPWLVRRRWWVLGVWTLVWSAAHVPAHGWGWHYFATGARLVTSERALHLFALDPELQSGPLTFVLLAPLVALPPLLAEAAAIAVLAALGVVAVRLLEATVTGPAFDAGAGEGVGRRLLRADGVLVVGLLVVPVWSELAVHWAHPDDALALVALLGAMTALGRRRPVLAAVLLAAAVDAKPWALVFVPLLLLADVPRRLQAAVVCAAGIALAWVPFVLADPGTLGAAGYRIPISDASVLHLAGVAGGTPAWCRPAQLALGLALVFVAVWRRRWSAVLVAGVCARLLLDPATKSYYEAGLVVATAVYDLALLCPVPWLTLAALLTVYLPNTAATVVPGDSSLLRAVLRAAFVVVAPLVALLRPVPATTVALPFPPQETLSRTIDGR